MRVVRLEIERFRGIEQMDCVLDHPLICLIGAGDTGKSTILDAVDMALSPRWNVGLSEVDFFQSDASEEMRIRVTVTDLPADLRRDDKFGLEIRGWSPECELHDEPEDGDAIALTIQFRADESLEPTWAVVNDRRRDGRLISSRDRALFNLVRFDSQPASHLAWTRGSALSGATADAANISSVLADVTKAAREAARSAGFEGLDAAVAQAKDGARAFGAGAIADDLCAGVDARSINARAAALSLHAGDLPVSTAGTGTQRLVAIGLQQSTVAGRGICIVDEIEHGLEPFRLRHLLRVLRGLADSADGPMSQVLLSTHSPVVVEELRHHELRVLVRSNGQVRPEEPRDDLQALLRAAPEAFLARRILVCEGKTEIGLWRGLSEHWTAANDGLPPSHTGTAVALGGGTSAPAIAQYFRELGYETALLADSDQGLDPPAAALTAAGVEVIQWPAGAIEDQLFADLAWSDVTALVTDAGAALGTTAVRDAVNDHLRESLEEDPSSWDDSADLRTAIAKVANKKSWYKQVATAEELGGRLGPLLAGIADSDLARTLERVGAWTYDR